MNEYQTPKVFPSYRRASEGSRLQIVGENPMEWSVEEVCNWFAAQPRLADLAPFIKLHCLDGHILLNYISNTVLRDELGITAFGQRVRLLEALEALKWKASIDRHDPRKFSYSSTNDSSTAIDMNYPRAASFTVSTGMDCDASTKTSDSTPSELKGEGLKGPTTRSRMIFLENGESVSQKEMKKAANRIADAEKKRRKRAELKKDPIAYAIYLQKERDRNAKRREKLKDFRGDAEGFEQPEPKRGTNPRTQKIEIINDDSKNKSRHNFDFKGFSGYKGYNIASSESNSDYKFDASKPYGLRSQPSEAAKLQFGGITKSEGHNAEDNHQYDSHSRPLAEALSLPRSQADTLNNHDACINDGSTEAGDGNQVTNKHKIQRDQVESIAGPDNIEFGSKPDSLPITNKS